MAGVKRVISKGKEYFYARAQGVDGEVYRRLPVTTMRQAKNAAAKIIEISPETPKERRLRNNLEHHLNHLIGAAKYRASRKNVPFTITRDDVLVLLTSQHYRCSISGLPFQIRSERGVSASRDPWRPSIDRIDPSLGYAPGNCRLICTAANLAINEWGEDVFLTLARGILDRKRERGSENGRGKRKTAAIRG